MAQQVPRVPATAIPPMRPMPSHAPVARPAPAAPTGQTLAQRVRAKYPGAYDDFSDRQLEEKIRAKFPGAYDDLPLTPPDDVSQMPAMAPMASHAAPPQAATFGNVVGANPVIQAFQGAGAGLMNTAFHGGDLIRRTLGMERVMDTPEAQAAMTPPNTLPGKVGYYGEQMAEFAAPLGRVARAVKGRGLLTRAAAEGAAGGGVAALQSGGDPAETGIGAAGGAVLPFAGAAGRMVKRAAAGAQEGGVGGAIASAVRTVAPSEPRTLLMQAIKPRSTRTNFEQMVDVALPEMKAAEAAIGRPVQGVDDLIEATKAAKRQIQTQLDQLRGPQRAVGVDLSSVADAMAASIPQKVRLENPRQAARLLRASEVYRTRFSVEEVETLLRETNAELDSFYQAYPHARQVLRTADAPTASLEAQAQALRTALYQALDAPGQGAAARELNRRYGALMEVEQEAYRRANVAKRQQPESLSEQIGAVRAAADMARGTWRLVHGDLSGAADIAAASAGRSAAKSIKDSQTTDALIRRAFADFTGAPAPVQMPPQRPVRGALGPGPQITPPPADPSFVRGVPAEYVRREVRGALPPAQEPQAPRRVFNMPGEVQADPSGGRTIPAAPVDYAIDPTVTVKAGGFRVKQFSSDPEAAQAAVATPEVQEMLKRMAYDLDTFEPVKGRMIRDPQDMNSGIYSHGAPGSPVGDDVRVISEQNVSNRAIKKAIADLLAGKRPSNRLHTAALDAAMGYLEKRPGYRGPSVPQDWIDAEPADPGFEAFSRAIDDLSK